MNISTKQKQTHRHREQTCGCPGRGAEGVVNWEFGISKWKLLHIEWINNMVLMYSTGNYIQYPVINYNEKEYKEECIYIFAIEALFCTVEINTTLYMFDTSILQYNNTSIK